MTRTITCLIGPTRFESLFRKLHDRLTIEGDIVVTAAVFGIKPSETQEQELETLAKEMIDWSSVVFVVDGELPHCSVCRKPIGDILTFVPCHNVAESVLLPYIGEHTKRELEYAKSKGKRILYLSEMRTL